MEIKEIKMWINNFPILHSEYLDWVIKMGSCKPKKRTLIKEFFNTLLDFADEDWLANYIVVEINGEKITFDSLIEYDLKSAIKSLKLGKADVKQGDKISITISNEIKPKEEVQTQKPNLEVSSLINQLVEQAKRLKAQAEQTDHPSFFYYQLPISEHILFDGSVRPKRVRRELLPYLRYFDLSKFKFDGVDIEGDDLSFTNIIGLNLDTVYGRSARKTNLQNVILIDHVLSEINLSGAILLGTYARINTDTTDITETILDETCLLLNENGVLKPCTGTAKTKDVL